MKRLTIFSWGPKNKVEVLGKGPWRLHPIIAGILVACLSCSPFPYKTLWVQSQGALSYCSDHHFPEIPPLNTKFPLTWDLGDETFAWVKGISEPDRARWVQMYLIVKPGAFRICFHRNWGLGGEIFRVCFLSHHGKAWSIFFWVNELGCRKDRH